MSMHGTVVPGAGCSKTFISRLCTTTEKKVINAYRSALKCLPSNPSWCYLFYSMLGGIIFQLALSYIPLNISCLVIIFSFVSRSLTVCT